MASGNQLQKELEKLAIQVTPETASFLKSIAAPMIATLGTLGIIGGAKYLSARKDEQAGAQAANDAYHKTMAKAPEFIKQPDDFNQRFRELYTISPTIAKNPQLATKLIRDRLTKGFTVDDLHRLSTIEYHASNTRTPPSASSVGRAAALGALEGTLKAIEPVITSRFSGGGSGYYGGGFGGPGGGGGPFPGGGPSRPGGPSGSALNKEIVDELVKDLRSQGVSQHVAEKAVKTNIDDPEAMKAMKLDIARDLRNNPEIKKQLDEISLNGLELVRRLQAERDAKKMEKKSSAGRVSDECLAVMLADRYVMAKTAGVLDTMAQGGKALGGHLAFMAPALALGAGTVLAGMAASKIRQASLSNEADEVFRNVRKSNELLLANPEITREAFDAIKSFAPDLAVKRNVLRTFLEHAVNTEGRMPIETIKQMADTQQIVAGKSNDGGFVAGLKGPMSLVGFKGPSGASADRPGASLLHKLKKRS